MRNAEKRHASLVDETGRLTSDSLSHYLSGIGGRPLLTAEDEVRLAQAMEAGSDARAALEAVGGSCLRLSPCRGEGPTGR